MFRFEAEKYVPDFILHDKSGYAVAKAIEGAMNLMNQTIRQGVDCIADYDTMPEWRLNELAWELNCLYDYDADVDQKRAWIKNAIPYYRLFGTPQAVYQYLAGYFGSIDLEENWQYGGDPYHFRVTVEGTWTAANEAWARRAIEEAKNVRSVLDAFRIGTRCYLGITAEGNVLARFTYPMTGTENWAGRWPNVNMLGVLNEAYAAATAEADAAKYAYPMVGEGVKSGQWPDVNMLGFLDEAKAAAGAEASAHKFPYPMAGTRPDVNTVGMVTEAGAGMGAEVTQARFPYPMAGTRPGVNTEGVLEEAAAAMQGDASPQKFPYPMAGTRPDVNTDGRLDTTPIQTAQAEDIYAAIPYKLCGEDDEF